MREAETTYCYGVSSSENTNVMMPYFQFFVANVLLPANPSWKSNGFLTPSIDSPMFRVKLESNPEYQNETAKESQTMTFYMITGTRKEDSVEPNVFSAISNEKYANIVIPQGSPITEEHVKALEQLTGVKRTQWFKSQTKVGNNAVSLEDVASKQKSKKKSKEQPQSSVNKLTTTQASDMVNAINKVSKKHGKDWNSFLANVEYNVADSTQESGVRLTKLGDFYNLAVFASKLVPTNFKESRIARFARLSEADATYVSDDEVLIEVHLMKRKKVKESMVYDLEEAMALLREATLTPFADGLFYLADDDGEPTETVDNGASVVVRDKDNHITGKSIKREDLLKSLEALESQKASEQETSDGESTLQSLMQEIVLPKVKEDLMNILNHGSKGMSYKTDNKSKVLTVKFTDGNHFGMFNEFAGFFSLRFTKTNERSSVASALNGIVKEVDKIASDGKMY